MKKALSFRFSSASLNTLLLRYEKVMLFLSPVMAVAVYLISKYTNSEGLFTPFQIAIITWMWQIVFAYTINMLRRLINGSWE